MNRIIPEPARLAHEAAEAVHQLNHVTVGGGYTYPSNVYDVLAELSRVAHMLPQAFYQAGQWLSAEAHAGRVENDQFPGDEGKGQVAVASLTSALASAVESANNLGTAIDGACGIASHLMRSRS